jgi:hypothetical protein
MDNEFKDIEIREDIPVERQLFWILVGVSKQLHQLREELHTMSTSIVTRAQFDAAFAALQQAEAARDAAVTTALNDLVAKIAAGTVTTPEDFTAELAIVTALQANAAALTQSATADDPGPVVVPSTPAAPAPTTGS